MSETACLFINNVLESGRYKLICIFVSLYGDNNAHTVANSSFHNYN